MSGSKKVGSEFPYGLQLSPGRNPTALGSFLYSIGVPGLYGGQRRSIEHDAMMGMVPGGQNQTAGGGGGQAQQPINFLPGGRGGGQQMRGGMMGLNYRLRR